MKNARNSAVVYINKTRHEIRGEESFMMLADYLRYSQGLTGTKIVCAEGDCGACSVFKASDLGNGSLEFEPINSCIVMMAQLDACHIVTVEGLRTTGQITAVQESMMNCHASQCGYCTPGFAITITHCVLKGKKDSQSIKNELTGNLCRCTGYQPLIEAAQKVDRNDVPSLSAHYRDEERRRDLRRSSKRPLHIQHDNATFFAPRTIPAALEVLNSKQDVRIIAAGTDVGVFINKGKSSDSSFLSLHLIEDLYAIKEQSDTIEVGARVNLSRLRQFCKDKVPEFAQFLNLFASPQIKNWGTLVGNVANGSPIGDTIPFLMVSNAVVHTADLQGSREIPITEFYKGYRSLDLRPGELITKISFKIPKPNEKLKLYKVSQRKDLDISTVSAAITLRFVKNQVTEAKIAFGGIGATVLRLKEVEADLKGQVLTRELIDKTAEKLSEPIKPLSDVRGSASYRKVLAEGLYRRYFAELGVIS